MIEAQEIWKPLPIDGYEKDYAVSNLGRIKRLTTNGKARAGRIQKLYKYKNDLYYFTWLCVNGKTKNVRPHRMVALAFLEKPQGDYEVNHINGDKLDNRLANLEYVTRQQNITHAADMLGAFKLSTGCATSIRRDYFDRHMNVPEIAKEYGVGIGAVVDVLQRRTWGHVEDGYVVAQKGLYRNPERFNAQDVIDMRKRYESGGVTLRALGDEYGISEGAVSRIVNRITWAHVK